MKVFSDDAEVQLGLSEHHVAKRWAVAERIAARGRESIALAAAMLDSDDDAAGVLGAEILGRCDLVDEHACSLAAATLLAALGDAGKEVASAVAINIARLPNVDVVVKLMNLRYDVRNGVRLSTAIALTHYSEDAVDALIELARDADREVRSWATFRLARGDIDNQAVRGVLAERANDSDLDIREEAVEGLSKLTGQP